MLDMFDIANDDFDEKELALKIREPSEEIAEMVMQGIRDSREDYRRRMQQIQRQVPAQLADAVKKQAESLDKAIYRAALQPIRTDTQLGNDIIDAAQKLQYRVQAAARQIQADMAKGRDCSQQIQAAANGLAAMTQLHAQVQLANQQHDYTHARDVLVSIAGQTGLRGREPAIPRDSGERTGSMGKDALKEESKPKTRVSELFAAAVREAATHNAAREQPAAPSKDTADLELWR